MRTSTKKPHASISVPEAQRAIYVDFEGFKGRPPSLLGILVDGDLSQVVLDSRLTAAATATGCLTADIQDVARNLKQWCQLAGRKLVAYSQHELDVFSQYAGVDFYDEYRDARMIAKRWWNICRRGAPRHDNGLKTFLKAIGRPHPTYFGEHKATSRLRAVLAMLKKRKKYEALASAMKAEWRMLLDYNSHDCHGMKTLVAIASTEIMQSGR